jgi:hypothetical protein
LIIFMGCVSHNFWKRLLLNFQSSEGMWTKKNYMKLAEEEEKGQVFFGSVGEAKFRFL